MGRAHLAQLPLDAAAVGVEGRARVGGVLQRHVTPAVRIETEPGGTPPQVASTRHQLEVREHAARRPTPRVPASQLYSTVLY